MGYATNYTLETSQQVPELDALMALVSEYPEWRDGRIYGVKWYEHEDHMRTLSAQHPSILFTLHGEGESPGDLWTKYFLGGKMQECKARIEYDSFDPAKLS